MHHVNGALITVVTAVALLLSGCGADTSGTASPDSTTSATEASTATTSESTTRSGAKSSAAAPTAKAPTGDITPPGSTLKVGERAVVPYKYGTDHEGTIALVVTAIDQGSNADLAAFGEKAKGITPYYIRISVENVGGTDLAHTSVSMRALGDDGKSTGVIITGETPQCQSESSGRDFTTAGAKYETCVLQGSREGAGVSAAKYNEGDDYLKSPITWKK